MGAYGIPYVGSKSKIATKIVSLLPRGKRLVDLFGGGGAITHYAILTAKWDTVLYNDIDPLITQLFIDSYNGKYKDYKRIVSREDFFKLKDEDPYVKYIYSFSNCGRTYLYSEQLEPIKLKFLELILSDKSVNEKRLLYEEIIRLLEKFVDNGGKINQLEQLQPLERQNRLIEIGRLKQLHLITNLEVSNISYEDYHYRNGDIVYCDIPYEGAGHKYNKNKFDVLKFYEWAKTRDFPVYFSCYEISDPFFDKKLIEKVKHPFKKTHDTKEQNEFLYCNRKFSR